MFLLSCSDSDPRIRMAESREDSRTHTHTHQCMIHRHNRNKEIWNPFCQGVPNSAAQRQQHPQVVSPLPRGSCTIIISCMNSPSKVIIMCLNYGMKSRNQSVPSKRVGKPVGKCVLNRGYVILYITNLIAIRNFLWLRNHHMILSFKHYITVVCT